MVLATITATTGEIATTGIGIVNGEIRNAGSAAPSNGVNMPGATGMGAETNGGIGIGGTATITVTGAHIPQALTSASPTDRNARSTFCYSCGLQDEESMNGLRCDRRLFWRT